MAYGPMLYQQVDMRLVEIPSAPRLFLPQIMVQARISANFNTSSQEIRVSSGIVQVMLSPEA